MNTVPVESHQVKLEKRRSEAAVGESIGEALTGIAAVVLAILGLVGALPMMFTAIATICIGVALLLEGGAIATRLHHVARLRSAPEAEPVAGLGAESVAGVAVVVLGILSLARIDLMLLLPVAAIVFGAGLLFASGAIARVSSIRSTTVVTPTDDMTDVIARESVHAASGTHVLVGVGSIVLGILALVGLAPLVLCQVAILAVGGSLLLSGAAVGGRIAMALRH